VVSDQRQENPLLLLGQYSDDELEEETRKRPKLEGGGSSPDILDDEVHTGFISLILFAYDVDVFLVSCFQYHASNCAPHASLILHLL